MNKTDGNNFHRIVSATRVVYRYMQVNGIYGHGSSRSTEQAMIDLVTDLRHMAEATAIDFDAVLSASVDLFDEEMW